MTQTDPRITALKAAVASGAATGDFPTSLIEQYERRGDLSEKQWPWVEKLAAQRAPAQLASSTAMTTIVAAFDKAQQKLKRPALLINAGGVTLRLNRAGPKSKYQGTINVTSKGSFDERTWYGRVNLDGAFQPSRDCTDAVIDALHAFAKDPVGTARAYGRLTGHCCFCARELNDKRSTTAGYGPICADRWGLPWGETEEVFS